MAQSEAIFLKDKMRKGGIFPLFSLLVLAVPCFLFGLEERFCYNLSFSEDHFDFSGEKEKQYLSLEETIKIVLKKNDKVFEAIDSLYRSGVQMAVADSEFDIHMRPNGRFGYCCVNQCDLKPCFGTGLTFSKKFTTGQELCITPNITSIDNRWNTGATFNFSQPLFRGISMAYNLNAVDSAKYANRKSLRAYYTAQVNAVLKAINYYYETVKQRQVYGISQESSERLRAYLAQARLKDKLGLGSELDIFRIEIELKNAEESELTAFEKLKDAEDKLKDLLFIPLDVEVLPTESLAFQAPSIPLEEALSLAKIHRIELEQASDNIKEAKRSVKVARHQTLPDLKLLFEYSTTGYDNAFWNFYCCQRNHKWDIALCTTSDLTSRKEMAQYLQTKTALAAVIRNYESTEADIELDVRKTLRNYQTTWERLHHLEEKVSASEASLKFAELKYERGLADNFEVIQAEKNIRTAKTQVFSALIDYIISEYKLFASIGTLMEKPCI